MMSFLSYIQCSVSEIYVLLAGILFFQLDEQEETMTTNVCSTNLLTFCSDESLLLHSSA